MANLLRRYGEGARGTADLIVKEGSWREGLPTNQLEYHAGVPRLQPVANTMQDTVMHVR
jgi:hypothetical protein